MKQRYRYSHEKKKWVMVIYVNGYATPVTPFYGGKYVYEKPKNTMPAFEFKQI